MEIQKALFAIPARELTRRVIWLASYLTATHGCAIHGDAAIVDNAKSVASGAVKNYDEQFPQQQ